MMRKIRSLLATVRPQSTNTQLSDHFTFTRKHARKIFLEHEISQQANFTLRLTTADAARTRFRPSRQWQIHGLLMQIRPRAVFAMRLNPAKRSPLADMPEPGRFSTREKVKN